MSMRYISSPPWCLHGGSGTALIFAFTDVPGSGSDAKH
jgi:hypothetical protein